MRLYSLVVLAAIGVSALSGQTFRGEIKGSVEDPSGAVLSETKVTATNVATGFSRATLSGSSGEFSIPDLPPGTYSVLAVKPGFQDQKCQSEVAVSRVSTVLFKLPLASQARPRASLFPPPSTPSRPPLRL
jgi:hypothetical protein